MKNRMDGKPDFFAFISHKKSDSRFALKLQRFIESYHLPTEIRRQAKLTERRLYPLCSYEVDFSPNPLYQEMQNKLQNSKYLILLCSEELIKNDPKYVNFEIRTFIECRKAEGVDPCTRIIPIVLSGKYGSEEHECCPEALKELGDSGPIALDRKSYKNDRELFLHVISGMLDINYAVLENRDKKRQRVKKWIAGIAAAVCLMSGALLGEYYIPRERHYLDFVLKDGIPEGIRPLSRSEYTHTKGHYVITEQMHRIQSLEYVNAFGCRIDHADTTAYADRPSAYIFSYTSEGLSSVRYENKAGAPYFILQYSAGSRDSADFRDPYNPAEAYFLGSGFTADPAMMLPDYNEAAHGDISRFRYEYSPEGYVTKIVFCADSTGRLAQDNAVYGLEYERDEAGRVVRTYFLDSLGARRTNADGIWCQQIRYDDRDDLTEQKFIGRDGALTANSDGIFHCVQEYNDQHNLICTSFFDADGKLVLVPSYGAAVQRMQVDERGNPVRIDLLDENGQPAGTEDYCAVAFTYDENGFMSGRTYLNDAGQPVADSNQLYAEIRMENDAKGSVLSCTYFGSDGTPVNNANGFAGEMVEYDGAGRKTKSNYYGADGLPADYCGYGYAAEVLVYDERGREICQSYFGADGKPVDITGPIFGYGYHKVETVYDYGAFTKLSQTFYNAAGEPVNSLSQSFGETYARTVAYIQNGKITSAEYFRADGSLYSALEVTTEYTAQSEMTEKTVSKDGSGSIVNTYTRYFRINGTPKQEDNCEYGEDGRLLGEQTLLYRENGSCQEKVLVEYDEHGRKASEYTVAYDEDGFVLSENYSTFTAEGTRNAEIRAAFHDDGTKTTETLLYGETGSILYRSVKREDGAGNVIESSETYYDKDGRVIG